MGDLGLIGIVLQKRTQPSSEADSKQQGGGCSTLGVMSRVAETYFLC